MTNHVGEADARHDVVGIKRDRISEIRLGIAQRFKRCGRKSVLAKDVGPVGFHVVRRLSIDAASLIRRERCGKLARDAFDNLALNRKQVVDCQATIVGFGPQVLIRAGIYQLYVDAHVVTRRLHATFQNVGDTEFACNLAQGFCRVAKFQHRGSRDHLQRR